MSQQSQQNESVHRLGLTIDSHLKETVLVATAIRGVCGITPLTADDINRVELCVVEVVNNAIEHAYGGEQGNSVNVELIYRPDYSLEIVVSDFGKTMPKQNDKAGLQAPDPSNPDTWQVSGRGLALVERLMDRTAYHSSPDGNAFHMVKHLGRVPK